MNQAQIKKIRKANAKEKSGLAKTIKRFQQKGYVENLTADFDHFSYGPEKKEIYPHELFFDELVRFENLSDPDDQSILYAISAPSRGLKGLYIESYGLYHENLSSSIIERIKFCHDIKAGTLQF